MSDECSDHPADSIPDECCEKPPIGFAATKKFTSCVPSFPKDVCATGEGHGSSEVSQAEADQEALDEAIEHAQEILKYKIGLSNYLGMHGPLEKEIFKMVAPLGTMDVPIPWEGRGNKKPWEYKVTAAIPHLDTIEPLEYVVKILRRQTERPYIIIVDTGSPPDVCRELELFRAPDLEVHFIRSNSWRHSSEPVTAALDLVQSICKTEFLFHTHADLFLKRFDCLSEMLQTCGRENPVVGYRMSPRDWVTTDWEWMVGHSCLMLYMPLVNEIGATWSMQRMNTCFGYDWHSGKGGWPDTEVCFNNVLRKHGIKPHFIGHDRNYERQTDDFMDHARSYPGSKVYAEEYHYEAREWMKEAIKEAKERLGCLK